MAKNANPKTWNFTGISRATYASNDLDGSGVNIDPIASFNTSANLLVVDVDASDSTDPDGTITSYDWDWGDATANGSGVTAQHTYASAGTYTITLTVTDNGSATNQTTKQVTVSATAPSHQLPVGNFEPAKMPLNLIYPRPDTETQTHARHRLMHSQMIYEIPIGIQGGAWPLHYEIITAPPGSTIGTYNTTTGFDADYGVLTVPAQGSGTYNITVRVTDQEGSSIDAIWSAEGDDSKFTFIDSAFAGTSTGTHDNPLKSTDDWYLGDNSDTTYLNQVVVLKQGSGNYVITGDPASNNNMVLDPTAKTPSLIAYPGDTPVFDCSGCKINTNNLADLTVFGIKFTGARQDVNNAHFIWCKNQTDRFTFWGCEFDNFSKGLVGTDNNSPVFVSARNGIKRYGYFADNTWNNIQNGDSSNGSYCDFYDVSDLLIERNTVSNSESTYGFWFKGTTAFVTVRANTCIDNNDGRQITFGYGNESALLPHDNEACWNQCVIPFADTGQDIILWAMSNGWGGQTYNSYMYRNTFVGGRANNRFPGVENYETDGNVIVNDSLSSWDTTIQTTVNPNLTATSSTTNIDANGDLINGWAANEGTHGYKVAA